MVAPSDQGHIALQYGRVLLFLEEREALAALTEAVKRANTMSDPVYGAVQNSFPVA